LPSAATVEPELFKRIGCSLGFDLIIQFYNEILRLDQFILYVSFTVVRKRDLSLK
jgi:hypothetical protein